MKKTTESDSKYDNLEQMNVLTILESINKEDQTVPQIIQKILPSIEKLITKTIEQMKNGGRLFYLGAGTSGRLGIVDASECPPTFGVDHGLVVGLIAGGDSAIRKAVEFAEDDKEQGWKDLQEYNINEKDVVIGIAASGTTPYVIGALEKCNQNRITTGSISCNPNSPLARTSNYSIVAEVGAEFVTGSTRMKSGTAQKLILNMISTATMIGLGKVKGNKMVDMQLSNNKLVQRGTKMIQNELNIPMDEALKLLNQYGNVRMAINNYKKNTTPDKR